MDQKSVVEQVLILFETGEEAVSYLKEYGLASNVYLLQDLQTMCVSLAGAIESLSGIITLKNKLKEIGMNASAVVGRLLDNLENGDLAQADMEFSCTVMPLFLFWKRYTTFFLVHAADETSLCAWHKEEREYFRACRQHPNQDRERADAQYDFSIVVLFYGNQEITKHCLDSIARHTKAHSYELITCDNGSDSETTAWCDTLPHKKKIHYPYNMGSSVAGNLIFTMAHLYAEGKYLLYISNDVVVTPQYDEILYKCMESDPRIALASPVYNSASNLQAISVPYQKNDLKGMQQFARTYNRCNPKKWVDRARLFQILGCYRMQALQKMELAVSPLFCYDMFADDDHSASLRRMGYRQVLCKDVFVHHYGSATIGDGQFEVMDKGRAQFYEKHGVDAWLSLGTDLCQVADTVTIEGRGAFRLLGINPKFGESVLAMVNRLKVCGWSQVTVDTVTEDTRYLEDMEGLFQNAVTLEDAPKALEGEQYDGAIIGVSLEQCWNLPAVFHLIHQHLKPGGSVVAVVQNTDNYMALLRLLAGDPLKNETYFRDPQESPFVRILTDDAAHALFQREGLQVVQEIFCNDSAWGQEAEAILKSVQANRRKQAKERLMRAYTLFILRNGG